MTADEIYFEAFGEYCDDDFEYDDDEVDEAESSDYDSDWDY
jgi:hypothetical protein